MGEYRTPLLVTIVATMIAWIAWLVAVISTNPDTSGWFGYAVFDTTLLAAITGSATIVGVLVRRHAPDHSRAIGIAVRQGMLVGIAVVTAVVLQAHELLTWVNFIFLVIGLTLLELFIISLRRRVDEYTNEHESTEYS